MSKSEKEYKGATKLSELRKMTKADLISLVRLTEFNLQAYKEGDPRAKLVNKMKELYTAFGETRDEMQEVIRELERFVDENADFNEALDDMESALEQISQYV